jgi:phenylpropionate dioxygenase-like ring-hydroxylating dioxygenase large terminal subunit
MTAMGHESEVSDAGVSPDPDGLIGEQIGRGRTLPSAWYTDEGIFNQEQRQIFRRSWQFVGHRGQVAVKGDYFTCEIGGVPIVVLRGKDDVVRALVNICRHRHNQVAHGCGNKRLLMCEYHAWTYKLDGSFNAAPRSKEDPDFDGSDLALASVAIDFLGDMIFVNPSNDAPPLLETLGPIPDLARQRGVPLDTAKFREVRAFEMEANWKIPWDNNIECYHCATVHSSWYKQAKLDPQHVYSYPVGTFHFEHVVDLHESASSGVNTDYSYYGWPVVCLTTDSGTGAEFHDRAHDLEVASQAETDTPAHAGFFMWRFIPLSARRTRIEWHMFSVDVTTQESLDEVFEGLLSVIREDKEICESVQRSHDSGAGELGTLIPAIDSEFNALVWEKLVHRALTQPDVGLYEPMLERSDTWPVIVDGVES